MKSLIGWFCLAFLAAGCGAPEPKPTAAPVTPAGPTPPVVPPKSVTPKRDDPAADQDKLRKELGELGVGSDGDYELRIHASALTAEGEFKPGIVEKLAKLKSVHKLTAIDLPAFGAGAGKALAAIPGLTAVDLYRTKATDAGLAAFGAAPALERLDLNNGSGEFPVVSNEALAGLAPLRKLKCLRCNRGAITGAGLKAVAEMSQLEELDLTDCPVDDSAFSHFSKLTELQDLSLNSSKVTGTGFAALKTCSKLRVLDLTNTPVADAELEALAALPKLATLRLNGTKVTDKGAIALSKSKTLFGLDLSNTAITDTGVVALAGLPKLGSLTLIGLPLTDVSLEALAKAPDLKALWLANNKFTKAGLDKFKAARPTVKLN